MIGAAQAIRCRATVARLGVGLRSTWACCGLGLSGTGPLPRLCHPGSKRGSSSAGFSLIWYHFASSLGLNASCLFRQQQMCPLGDRGLPQQLCSLRLSCTALGCPCCGDQLCPPAPLQACTETPRLGTLVWRPLANALPSWFCLSGGNCQVR